MRFQNGGNAMLTFTRRDGKTFSIEGKSVLRVREAVYSDKNPLSAPDLPGTTRLDADHDYYSMESLADVVKAVKTELPTLVQMRSRSGVPIWINAKAAAGPYPVSQSEIQDGIHSRLTLGGRISLLVGNTHQEVYDAIKAAGGEVQPMPTDGAAILQNASATVGDLKSAMSTTFGLPKRAIKILNSEGKHAIEKGVLAQLLKGFGNRE
jgi:hypothetical protein